MTGEPDCNEEPAGDREVVCSSPEATRALAAGLARGLTNCSVVALEGPLGAGKTEFVKGLADGLGCDDVPTSPTFAIAHEYGGGRALLFHFDFYRLESEDEVAGAGFEDCLGAGVVVVEWASKFPASLPPDALRVSIRIDGPQERMIRVNGAVKP